MTNRQVHITNNLVKTMNKYHMLKPLAFLVPLAASVAFAQEQPRTGPGLEEIIVVAQRREQNVQDVPIAITALSSTMLEKMAIGDVMELRQATPSLNYTQRAGSSMISIRGVTTPGTAPGSEASVATYVDGVYYFTAAANLFSFGDIERVEVLKGPQGTLFGRNATGGLIHVITKTPSAEPEANVTVGYGSYDTVNTGFYLNGGSETVATSLSYFGSKQDEGWGTNLFTGKDVYMTDEYGLRGKLLWNISDDSSLLLSADYLHRETDLGRSRRAFPGSYLSDRLTAPDDDYDINSNFQASTPKHQFWGVSARYQHEFEWGTFTSTTAYRDFTQRFIFDSDTSTLALQDAVLSQDDETKQQEFLLVGESGKLNWTTGLFLFQADAGYTPLALRSPIPAAAAVNIDRFGLLEVTSYAAFLEGNYAITDATSITAGVRYTIDDWEVDGTTYAAPGFPLPAGTVIQRRVDSFTKEEPTWRLSVDHQLNQDMLVYASYSRGFKSGSYNSANFVDPATEPEILDAYEIGLKSELLDSTARLNLSAFFYDYQDLQLFLVAGGVTRTLNAANAEIMGAEAELTLSPQIDKGVLDVMIGLSVLDSEYKEFPNGVITTPRGPALGGNTVTAGDLAGNDLLQVPDYTVNLGINYEIPLATGTLGLSGNYYRNDGFWWESDNRIKQDAYGILNARVQYEFGGEGDKYRLWLKGQNLTDEYIYTYGFSNASGDQGSPGAPRTWMLGVDMKIL